MGTRSFIGIENLDGRIVSIYCNWDGDPAHHAPILLKSYNDAFKINALLTLGNLSELGLEIGEKHDFADHSKPKWCTAYARDKGEAWRNPLHSNGRSAYVAQAFQASVSYVYLFVDGVWLFSKVSQGFFDEPQWQILSHYLLEQTQ